MSLRNRAFWALREAMDAVRSADRYVYRKQPKILVAFRASSSRARSRATAAKTPVKPAPAVAAVDPSPTPPGAAITPIDPVNT